MDKKELRLQKVFKEARYECGQNLAPDIWQCLMDRNQRIARLKLWSIYLVGLLSLAGLVPAWKTLSTDLSRSGFYEYSSLAFSDSKLIVSYWREYIFSLAESLPTMSIIFALTLVFIFFLSLKYAMRNITRNRLSFTGYTKLSF